MADSGRLGELKRKFDENPRRYFAPLANEYRKAGDTDRAIELCRTYLPEQPTHMSGYVVYGQALFEAGRLSDATEVFHRALALDPENIIALRHLGDIARQSDDRATAMQWYGKVLELDPKNEEITAYITGLASSPPARQAPPTIRPEPEPDPNAVALSELIEEPDAHVSTLMINGVMFEQVFEEFVLEPTEPAPESAELGGQQVEEEEIVSVTIERTEVSIDFGSAADETAQFFERSAETAPEEEEIVPAPRAVNDDEPVAEEVPVVSGSAFVTETMADLYLHQGFTAAALDVYRKLAEGRDDPELREKIGRIERELASEQEDEPSENTASEVAETAPEPSESSEPRQTIRDFFAAIGAKRPTASVVLPNSGGLAGVFDSDSLDPRDASAAAVLAGAYTQAD